MKHAFFYITCICVFLKYTVSDEVNTNSKLDNYLQKKTEEVQATLHEKFKPENIEIKEIARSGSHIPGTYKSVFSIFNDTFIMMDDKIFQILFSNSTITIEKIKELDIGSIMFTKVVEFEDFGIILAKTEEDIYIYKYYNKTVSLMHSIFAPYTVDAHFFINQNNLHLILANNNDNYLTVTSIYKWIETYFDETEYIYTTGATKVTSFTYNFFEIIIILQNSPKSHPHSTVYRYNFGTIKKLQYINTVEPVHIDVYTNIRKYVVVFEKSKNNIIYSWDGFKLVQFFRFQTENIVEKSVILQRNSTSIILVPSMGKIQGFRLLPKRVIPLGDVEFRANYSIILEIQSKSSSSIIVTGLSQNNTVYISQVQLIAHFSDTDQPKTYKDILKNCFHDLEVVVYSKKRELEESKVVLSQIKDEARDEDTNDSTTSTSDTTENGVNSENDLDIIKTKLEQIQLRINDYQDIEENNLVINNDIKINGLIEAEKMTAKNLNFNQINGQKWDPQNWLRYNKSQTITGPVTVKKIVTKELETTSTLLTDLLTKNGDQDIWSKFEVVNLTVNKINAERINDVKVKDIYLKSDPQLIEGLKTFENLETETAKIKLINEKPANDVLSFLNDDPSSPNITFNSNVEIENLIVDSIDDIHWNTFRDSVFRVGITKEINGDLTFSELKANNVTLKTIKGVEVEGLLTKSTDQIIDASLEFNTIFANNITTNTTNDIKLADAAVQFGNYTLVEAPVKFDKLYVRENLTLVGKLDEEFFLRNGEHIIGTNESDLWQSYEGIVRIKGNLFLKNVTLQPKAKLFVAEEELDPNIRNAYWTKNTTQSIPVHFEVQNNVSTPHLLTKNINQIDFNQYMLNKDGDTFETSYVFENISVLGDIFLNSNANHTPNLTKLNEEAVKTSGTYYISGKKIYTDTLRAENLVATTLGGIGINDTMSKKSPSNTNGTRTFKNIVIKGNLTCNLQSIEFINGVNISNLLENSIYIDNPQNIEKINFKSITVQDLWVTNLNNYKVKDHIENVEKLLASNVINSLMVDGNVTLNTVTGVSRINNIEFDKLLNKKQQKGKTLTNLEFLGHVKVNNLKTSYINDINLRKLIKTLLYRNIKQDITAKYSFKNIKTENLIVTKINNISMTNLIDISATTSQTIIAPGGVEFASANLKKSLDVNRTSPCNLVEALKKFKEPPSHKWNKVEVKGNATFLDPDNIIHRLFEKAVLTTAENTITAPVKFSQHVVSEKVITTKHMNGVDLQEIIEDAVMKDSDEEQVITGRKIFPTMEMYEVAVRKNTDIPVVNDIDIPDLDRVIVRKDNVHDFVLGGKKTFYAGLQCEKFYSKKISDVDIDNIVNIEKLRKIPHAIFDSIEVLENLNISSVNSLDFEGFLKNRLLTESMEEQIVDGVYYFDNLQVENMETPSINNIKMDNVVFDNGQQNITATKCFTKPVDIFGNLTCEFINSVNISEMYRKALTEDDANIDGSVTIQRPSIVNGSITTEYINGYPVERIKEILNQETVRSATQNIRDIQNDIAAIIHRNIDHIKFLATDFMYIEKSQALQISVRNTNNANIMHSKGYILIQADGEESGTNCGLPETCRCPVQYSIEISPEHSVTIFPNKGSQRMFTYDDDRGMIVHLLSNSFSTNSTCRTNSSKVFNEVSMMTWNALSVNSTGEFHHYDKYITGYISGAEFFTLHGKTYAVIGRYYNPITNNHDLNCYLFKFSDDKRKVQIIQKIPTRGAWSIYLFHTAQGVTLIIGNMKTTTAPHTQEETQIYRFDERTEKFDLLRIIPAYGCSMATGVVLGIDSLIVLAHRYAPIEVLKYDHYYDNYYLYQSFELDAPVAGISVFYTGGFGISDAYLCTVTSNGNYFVYSFRYIEGWKLESSGELEGLRNLIPFKLKEQSYLFAASSKLSSLLTVVKHGSV